MEINANEILRDLEQFALISCNKVYQNLLHNLVTASPL